MCLGIFILSVVPLIRSAKGAPAVNKLATDVASEGYSQTTKFIPTDKTSCKEINLLDAKKKWKAKKRP